MDIGDVYRLLIIAYCSKPKRSFHRHNGGVKIAATYSLRLYQAAVLGVWTTLACTPVAAESENVDSRKSAFEPGYRFVQTSAEYGGDLTSRGIDLGWAAINRRGFELDLGTGLRVMKHHIDGEKFGGWTAFMAITAPWPVAPYVEVGFDAGEILGEIILDRAVKNSAGRNWIDPDSFIGAGLKISLTQRIQLKAYYKLHYVESERYHTVGSRVSGLALVLRFPRRHLEWWQIPL